jgi:hypothetical protein
MSPTSRAPVPARDEILTRDEVAAWLKVKPRQVERLGLPLLDLGRKTKRYLTRDVVQWLERRRMEHVNRPPVTVEDETAQGVPHHKRWGTGRRRRA